MDQISEFQLEKYQSILHQIELEQKKHDKIKQQKEDLLDKLRILKILSKTDLIRDKLFQCKVKIFRNTYKIFDIFPDALPIEQLTLLSQHENCFYYLIEIFVSQMFHEKLVAQKWTINISISNSQMRCNKSISLMNRVRNPITAVVPFSNKLENSLVEIYLVSFFEYKCSTIKLASIMVDASYRFEENKPDRKNRTLYDDILRVQKVYNPAIDTEEDKIENSVVYKISCNWSHEKLLEVILKNCYHNIHPSKILNKSDDVISLAFLVDGAKSSIILKSKEKSLEIESNIHGLHFLKTYLFEHSNKFVIGDFRNISPLAHIRAIKDEVHEEMEKGYTDVDVLRDIFDKYMKYIAHYPL